MVAVVATREPIYAALWDLILNDARVQGQFVTSSRAVVDIQTMTRDQMPALFLLQHGEQWVKLHNLDAKRTLDCSLLLYAWTSDQRQMLPATLCNNMMDVLDDLIENPGNPQNVQTLGGLVDHCHIEGQVVIYEAQLSTGEQGSIMLVPMRMMLP